MLLNIIGTFLLIFIAVKLYYKRKFSYWQNRGVPSLPASIPFGHMTEQVLLRKPQGPLFEQLYNHFEQQGLKYGGAYLVTRPVFLPTDPDLIKTIIVKDFTSFHDRPFHVDEKLDPLSAHLFLLKGSQWRFMRTKLSPTFTSGKMKMMFPTLVTCGYGLEYALETIIDKDEPIDIKDISARFTTDVIGSCAFGLDCNSLKNPDAEFRKFGRRIFENSTPNFIRRFITAFLPGLKKILQFSRLDTSIQDFFMNAIQQTVNYREVNQIERKDFMNLLIKLKNNESVVDDDYDEIKNGHHNHSDKKMNETGLTFNQLAAQAFVFFIAGFETSSSTMTFCLYELSKNQEIQEKLRREIIETLKKHNGELTYEAIMEIPYMDKVIKETLRKYPIVPILHRECVNDYQVPNSNGLVLEKGTAIFISTFGLHRNPKYYPDPLRFDPERFSEEAKSKRNPYVYLPFGEGPRNCIGMRFGLMQTKVGVALMLKKFKFTLNEKTSLPFILEPKSVILSVKDGIWLNAQKLSC